MTPPRGSGGHPLPRLNGHRCGDKSDAARGRSGQIAVWPSRSARRRRPSGGRRRPLNGGHRRQSLSPRFDKVPDCYLDVLVVLARVRLGGLAPAPVEQGLRGGHARSVGCAVSGDARQCLDADDAVFLVRG